MLIRNEIHKHRTTHAWWIFPARPCFENVMHCTSKSCLWLREKGSHGRHFLVPPRSLTPASSSQYQSPSLTASLTLSVYVSFPLSLFLSLIPSLSLYLSLSPPFAMHSHFVSGYNHTRTHMLVDRQCALAHTIINVLVDDTLCLIYG